MVKAFYAKKIGLYAYFAKTYKHGVRSYNII